MDGPGTGPVCVLIWAVVLVHGQNVNVARDKTYSQSTFWNSNNPASQAANGDTSGLFPANCIHTAQNGDLNPWWQVDLGRTFPVHSISVWARTDWKRRLYPSTITVNGQTCASITSFPTNTRRQTVTCSSVMYGRRVQITRQGDLQESNADRTLNLCEVEIWVPSEVSQCPVGKYGASCNSDCSNNCGKGSGKNFCHQSTGYCYDDCEDGYYKSGSGCVNCSSNCQTASCDKQTGACDSCVGGWYGDNCTTHCPAANCQQCEQDTGRCEQCVQDTNLKLPDCSECLDGFYKPANNTKCDRCTWTCHSATVCDRTTGNCPVCPSGKQGDRCDQVDKGNGETDNTPAIIGSVVGVGLFLGICIVVLAVVIWFRRSRDAAGHSRTAKDETDFPVSPTSPKAATRADRGQAAAVLQAVQEEEDPYEKVGGTPMTTKTVYSESDNLGYAQSPKSDVHHTNPYDQPAVQYRNTGEVHIYDPVS